MKVGCRHAKIARALLLLLALVITIEADARGRGGRGAGRGVGGRGGGGSWGEGHPGVSRHGPASYGSVRHRGASSSRQGSPNYRVDDRGSIGQYGRPSTPKSTSRAAPTGEAAAPTQSTQRNSSGTTTRETPRGGTVDGSKTVDGDKTTRQGTITGPDGETIDYSGSVTRTEDGFSRSGSFESSTGASGSGSADVKIGKDGFESAERSRELETADGETASREISSERDGDWIVREGDLETSTGIDAESVGAIKKTDDGFIAQGAVEGDEGIAGGTIVRDGDDVYARGAATDGDQVTWGRAHCNDGRCYGGRVTADIDHYYVSPYYYYPYYYAYYACPPGTTTVVRGYYGTPVYSCSHTVIISTSVTYYTSGQRSPVEVAATTSPVVMYELSPDVVVYSTSYKPQGVYAKKESGRYFWSPGIAEESAQAKEWIDQAVKEEQPSSNATVITYTIGDRPVYLTNEAPVDGVHSERSVALFVWIPGVRDPSAADKDAIATAITVHGGGGSTALEAEVRKLQEDRSPPPSAGESEPAAG